jgi:hypothetical protein
MHVENENNLVNDQEQSQSRKERVSFSTNMTPEDEFSDGTSTVKTELELATVVERFQARKFGTKAENKTEKRTALKVNSAGNAKKQKPPVISTLQGAIKMMGQEGLELMIK